MGRHMMQIKGKATPVVLAVALLGVMALAVLPEDARYVAAPIFASFVMFFWLWMELWDRDKNIPFFDAGIFCVLATFAYTAYPLANYWADGFKFGILSDYRLWNLQVLPVDLAIFHLRHILYMFCLVVFYAIFRGKGELVTGNVKMPSRSTRKVILIVFILLGCYYLSINVYLYHDLSSLKTYSAKTRHVHEVMSNMPRIFVQLSDKFRNIFLLFKFALLFIVIKQCKNNKWLAFLIAWIIAEILLTVVMKNTRTGLVLFILSTVLMYHRLIKPFTMRFLLISGVMFFLFFNFIGMYRAYTDIGTLKDKLSASDGGLASGANEFQALFATTYDVFQRKNDGVDLPWYLYINDFITVLPPQQIMPFEKIRADEWYMQELGLDSDIGYGFMWGVITQSIVGLDWYELALRGALLGFILAMIHRWYIKNQTSFLGTIIYMYLCLRVYYTFRDTTFSILAFFVWDVVPFYILLRLGVLLLPRKTGKHPGQKIALSHN